MYIEFNPGMKHGRTNAEISESTDAFTDCGYLLKPEEVVVDIDSIPQETIRVLLTTFDIHTQVVWTDRGAHLYFRKSAARAKNGPCALGFPIETKTTSNTPNGITVKRNGILRKTENAGKRQMIPWFFASQKQYADLTGLAEGDGRNNALFVHRGRLDCHPDTMKILRFINEHIFAEPLSEEELQLVGRDRENGTDGKRREYEIANEIMNQYHCVQYQGSIWFWDEDRYVTDPEDQCRLKKLIFERCPGRTTRFVDEVIKQIYYRGAQKKPDAFPIRFRNGVLMRGSFVPVKNYQEFTPYYIDIDYDPKAEPVTDVDDYIGNITGGDPEYRKFLLETMAYVMETDPERIRANGHFFMLRGDGANGKGTLLQIIKRIYGAENCTALSIKELADTRYQVTMVGKLANLGDDVHPEAINNDQMKVLKNICTADTVSTRMLFHQSFSTTYTVKLFFTTNTDIHTFEKGYAYKRRVVWLPMFNRVDRPDPRFISRMTTLEALKYWIRLLVEAYLRMYESGSMTECAVVEQYNAFYHQQNNYMAVFLETLDVDRDLIGRTGPEMKEQYNMYNDDINRPYNPRLFNEALKEKHIGPGTKRIGGKIVRVYMRQEDTQQKVV